MAKFWVGRRLFEFEVEEAKDIVLNQAACVFHFVFDFVFVLVFVFVFAFLFVIVYVLFEFEVEEARERECWTKLSRLKGC